MVNQMGQIWRDLLYIIRGITKNPGFATVALLVMAIAIAVNTASFSIVHAVLFRPLAVAEPDQLVYVYSLDPRALTLGGISYDREFSYLKTHNLVFEDMLARNSFTARLAVGGDPVHGTCEAVSINYFDMLGLKPLYGRTFEQNDDGSVGGPLVAVISYELWESTFHSDRAILGKSIEIGESTSSASKKAFTVVGVMGPSFSGMSSPWNPTQVWVPLTQWCIANQREDRIYDIHSIEVGVIARLRNGVTMSEAREVVSSLGKALQQTYHPNSPNLGLQVTKSPRVRLPFDSTGRVIPTRLFATLMAVSGVVLVIAGTNLAGILMARGITRRGEIAVRLAIGASRSHLIRQLLS